MDRTQVAATVAADLFDAETAVDEALARAARLMRRMIVARRELGVSPAVVDPAMRRVEAAVNALGDAQREIVRTHDALEDLRRDLDLPARAFGPLVKPEGRAAENGQAA